MSEQLRRNPNTRPRLLSGYIIAQGGGGCQAFGGEKFGKMKKFFGGGWGGGEVGVGRGDRTKIVRYRTISFSAIHSTISY